MLCAAFAPALFAQVTQAEFSAIRREGQDNSQVMAHLDHLVNRIGPRLTGSDNLTNACEWAADHFRSFGITNAHLEQWGEFAVGFNRGPWWGRMTQPERMELVCNTDAWSAGTRGPARGPLRMAPRDEAGLAAMRGTLRGTWLMNPAGGKLLRDLSAAMVEEGGLGFVAAGRGELLLTDGRPTQDFDQLPQMPFVRVLREHADRLAELLDQGQVVEVEFDIRNHFEKGPIALYNVIADIPGTEHPDEFVVVGGHIDSWDGATGTTDNGTGTATTLEAARILMAIGAKPKRTIRFMLWSGEEQGLLGSRAWVQAHKDEMERYSACLVHDGGTNYLSGIAGMAEMHPQLEAVFAPVVALAAEVEMPFKIRDIEAFRPIGSDHESFTAAGVPGFFWDQAGRANYTYTHHTQFDTYGAAIPEYQRHSSIVIAVGALGLANLPDMLTRENMKVQRFGGQRPGRMLGVMIGEDGVTIDQVTDGSAAAKAGLKSGDKLLRIGDTAIEAQRDIRRALLAGGKKQKVTFARAGAEQTVEVEFDQ